MYNRLLIKCRRKASIIDVSLSCRRLELYLSIRPRSIRVSFKIYIIIKLEWMIWSDRVFLVSQMKEHRKGKKLIGAPWWPNRFRARGGKLRLKQIKAVTNHLLQRWKDHPTPKWIRCWTLMWSLMLSRHWLLSPTRWGSRSKWRPWLTEPCLMLRESAKSTSHPVKRKTLKV